MSEFTTYRRKSQKLVSSAGSRRDERKSPVLLLLTATVTPPEGVPNLRRTDIASRRQDYREALRFYLTRPTSIIDRIVLLENSRSNLDDLWSDVEELAGDKDVEFVSFYGLDYPPTRGRGYGEFKMIDAGFRYSELLGAIKAQDVFWKSTGRLRVLNIAGLIRSAPKAYQVLCDFRRWPQRAVDWRVMSCTRDGYREVYEGKFSEFSEDLIRTSGEAYDFSRLEPTYRALGIVPRFPVQPQIAGISGEHNLDYYSGINVVKHWVRVFARRAVPMLWI